MKISFSDQRSFENGLLRRDWKWPFFYYLQILAVTHAPIEMHLADRFFSSRRVPEKKQRIHVDCLHNNHVGAETNSVRFLKVRKRIRKQI